MDQHKATDVFSHAFGTKPSVIACAPGRVEVLGNHTDYNEGFTLSAAIDKYIYVAIAPSPDTAFRFCSGEFSGTVVAVDNAVPVTDPATSWINYPLGVYAMLKEAGYNVKPFSLAVHGTIPPGAGLSSSAALEVATGLALAKLYGCTVGQKEMAKICQKAEHTFVGTKCGLLDQFSSLFGKKGHLLSIDFRTLEYSAVPVPSDDLCLAITISGVTHALVTSAYNDRRNECFEAAAFFAVSNPKIKTLRDIPMETYSRAKGQFSEVSFNRGLHVIGENDRVKQGTTILSDGHLANFGELMYQSHESSRINFENSCPELDRLVAIAKTVPGVYGSRLSGGGFGGATLTFLPKSSCAEFEKQITTQYKTPAGNAPVIHFARIGDGAGIAG